ncbi:hypothetical protein TNCV_872691 [Trichonephila clavipes]|nr:hypothetical protein TNCV_872691 [Trichonephila clavipes]
MSFTNKANMRHGTPPVSALKCRISGLTINGTLKKCISRWNLESLSPLGLSVSNLPEKCRINNKFLVKLKKSATKTFKTLTEAYGDKTLSRAHVFERHKWFSGGRDTVEDDELAGHPSGRGSGKNGKAPKETFKNLVP